MFILPLCAADKSADAGQKPNLDHMTVQWFFIVGIVLTADAISLRVLVGLWLDTLL